MIPRATIRTPGGPESSISYWELLQKGGVSITYPRQINKPVLRPWYVHHRERVCHQANSVTLRMVSIPERTKLFKIDLKNKSDSPSPKAKITPSNTPSCNSERTAFAVQLKAICYNVVIFFILVPYYIIQATCILKLKEQD